MLLNGSDIIGTPIMSLQTGAELARTSEAIINPHNLSILAYTVTGPFLDSETSLLRVDDIRELGSIGMIVDSSDEFIQPDDIVRQADIYNLRFELTGKPVYTTKREKVGKVIEYTVESSGFVIQQLTVKRPLLKSLNDPELLIHRSQVVEVTDDAIIIKDAKIKKAAPVATGTKTYTNPFRGTAQPAPIPEASSASDSRSSTH